MKDSKKIYLDKKELAKIIAIASVDEMKVRDLKDYAFNQLLNFFSSLSKEELESQAKEILGKEFGFNKE